MTPAPSPGLKLDDIAAGYHGKNILHGVSLEIAPGGALTVIGPNGSGKSTLLKSVAGLLPLSAGSIRLGDTAIDALDAPARARLGLAYVPQEGNVFPNLSVADNLRMGWDFLQPRTVGHARRRERTEAVLAMFPELRPKLNANAGLLSGGQRQMAAMASALMQNPSVLVLDEPSAGLSPRNAGLLFERIAGIRATGVTLLMIEQNVKLGLKVADTGVVLVAGQLKLSAPAAQLATDPTLHELYFGGR